jgi:hypothetical protein
MITAIKKEILYFEINLDSYPILETREYKTQGSSLAERPRRPFWSVHEILAGLSSGM